MSIRVVVIYFHVRIKWLKQQCFILCFELHDCAQSFVFVYKFCLNKLMRFLKIGHWITGGTGGLNLPLPYEKIPPPHPFFFFFASSLESQFSPPAARLSPSSRTPPTLFSPGPPPPPPDLFDLAKRTWKKSNRPLDHCSISFFIYGKLVSPKLVVFFSSVNDIWDLINCVGRPKHSALD